MASTRKTIRRDVLKSLGDLRILTATQDSASNVLFYDNINLTAEVGAYNGREVYFTDGTAANLAQTRYVVGSSSTSSNIQFSVTLPSAPVVGDECEMLNMRGIGFRIQDVHDAINQSIRVVADGDHFVDAPTYDVSYTNGSAISLPASFATVEDVMWIDDSDSTFLHSIPKSSRPNGKGWWVDRATRTVRITGRTALSQYGARTVRIWGLAYPSEMYDDNDVCTVNNQWLIANVKQILLQGRYYRMPTTDTERLMYDAIQEARNMLPRVVSRRGPFSESL